MSWQIVSTLNQLSMAPAQARAPMLAGHAATINLTIRRDGGVEVSDDRVTD